MKLRNKKNGKIIYSGDVYTIMSFDEHHDRINKEYEYNSLAELNKEWEDYEEPKGTALDLMILTLTNFIVNEPDEEKVDLEDCKVMLEKLEAWKRLENKGFRFTGWYASGYLGDFNITGEGKHFDSEDTQKDLGLLFRR